MDRRTFIGGFAGGLLAWPLAAAAQQTGKIRRLGNLTAGTITTDGWGIFFETLRELGWSEGQNLLIERRAAGGKADLVPGPPGVPGATGGPCVSTPRHACANPGSLGANPAAAPGDVQLRPPPLAISQSSLDALQGVLRPAP